jgi:hypothetical protein
VVEFGIWTGGVKVLFSFLAKKKSFIKAKDQCFFWGFANVKNIYIPKSYTNIARFYIRFHQVADNTEG